MEALGYSNFCMACRCSRNENGETVCRGTDSRFYGLSVKNVLSAPCIKKSPEGQKAGDES